MSWKFTSAFTVVLTLVSVVPAAARLTTTPDPEPKASRQVALLIGIADYSHFDEEGPAGQTDLRGPRNDVERMRRSLERWGFGTPEDTRVLLDSDASAAGIAEGFRWLAERAVGPDDAVVIFYSGHGSSAPDADGDEAEVTPGDTRDEGLVPWDARTIDEADQLVIDDQIREWLASLQTHNVTLIIDACYSGTLTRGESQMRAKGAPAPDGGAASATVEQLDFPDHTLITASRADQTAVELRMGDNRIVHGLLTYHLTRALDGAEPTARYDDIMRQVRRDVAGSLASQLPQLEGNAGARVFQVQADIPHKAFATVADAGSGLYSLDVGAVHGVRASAIYDVFGPDEMEFRGQPLGQLVVDSVGELHSLARVDEDASALPAGARAVLARVPRGAARLETLKVHSNDLNAVRPLLDDLAWVELVAAEDAHAIITGSGSNLHVLVEGLEVEPRAPGQTLEESMCERLTRAFALNAFELLENPHPDLTLEVQVTPRGAQPEEYRTTVADSMPMGTPHDIWVRVGVDPNRDVPPLYLSAAIEGQVSPSFVFYPRAGSSGAEIGRQPLRPDQINRWWRIWAGVTIQNPPFGQEFIRVLVDTDQYSLTSLVETFPTCGARRGKGSTGQWGTELEPITGWTSVRHPIFIVGDA